MSGLAEILDNAVKGAQTVTDQEEKDLEIRDLADNLSVEIKLTREFHTIIMNGYEDLEPNEKKARKLYFDTQTMGWVLLDRLIALEDNANALVKKLFNH